MEILDTGFDMDAYEMKKHMFTDNHNDAEALRCPAGCGSYV